MKTTELNIISLGPITSFVLGSNIPCDTLF